MSFVKFLGAPVNACGLIVDAPNTEEDGGVVGSYAGLALVRFAKSG